MPVNELGELTNTFVFCSMVLVLSNLFPAVPVLALIGTATRATKSGIIDSLGLSDPIIVESNPAGQSYTMHLMFAAIEETGNSILQPIDVELKAKKNQMPLTLIYRNLETIAECFAFFSNSMGKDQYYPSTALPLAKNRLFSQYHAQYPKHTLSMNEIELFNNW
mgnify:CR=1 FL=1